MKKVRITLLLAVALAVAVFACGCGADTTEFDYSSSAPEQLSYTVLEDGDFTYNIYDDHAELVGYKGST